MKMVHANHAMASARDERHFVRHLCLDRDEPTISASAHGGAHDSPGEPQRLPHGNPPNQWQDNRLSVKPYLIVGDVESVLALTFLLEPD